MAEQVISPGVFTNEDIPTITEAAAAPIGAAVIGPTPLGPMEIPTLCTTFSDFQAKFGRTFESGGVDYSFLTSQAAFNYFRQGGTNLLVTRVPSGSAAAYTGAQSTFVPSSGSTDDFNVFTLTTFSEGALMNSQNGAKDRNFATGSDGSANYESGSRDNLRWEITNADYTKGTFTLSIRQGNDTNSAKKVLETFRGVNLDPNSDNFISKRIGDQYKTIDISDANNPYIKVNGSYPNLSNFVYVSEVSASTPDFLDANGNISDAAQTASLPHNSNGGFYNGGGTLFTGEIKLGKDITAANMQGLGTSQYDNVINLLKDKDLYYFNTISLPGFIGSSTNQTTAQKVIDLAEERGDCLAVLDLGLYDTDVTTITSAAELYDSSYAATYYPWLLLNDAQTGAATWAPPSTVIPAAYVFNDETAGAWFAPAGARRGAISSAISLQRALPKANRDTLYDGKVNPLVNFPNAGIAIYGQKTLQAAASATDRVNVRRLLLNLKNFIGTVAQGLVFEPNSLKTRNSFLSTVVPYLDLVQRRQGLYAYKVTMDDTNNGPDVIDRNELRGAIYIQPVKAAEFVILDFNVLPTGAEFPG
jgi:hypothetical protein